MTKSSRPKVMPNAAFRGMDWVMRLMDLFGTPTKALEKIRIDEGSTVVDFACGPARYTPYLARKVGPQGRVFAVDNQPLAISRVEEKASQQSLDNIEAILVESFDTGIAESSVDLVVCLDALHQIAEREALFEELHRILKPDGRIFLEPGHMRFSKAREAVLATGLFDVAEQWKHELLLVPRSS